MGIHYAEHRKLLNARCSDFLLLFILSLLFLSVAIFFLVFFIWFYTYLPHLFVQTTCTTVSKRDLDDPIHNTFQLELNVTYQITNGPPHEQKVIWAPLKTCSFKYHYRYEQSPKYLRDVCSVSYPTGEEFDCLYLAKTKNRVISQRDLDARHSYDAPFLTAIISSYGIVGLALSATLTVLLMLACCNVKQGEGFSFRRFCLQCLPGIDTGSIVHDQLRVQDGEDEAIANFQVKWIPSSRDSSAYLFSGQQSAAYDTTLQQNGSDEKEKKKVLKLLNTNYYEVIKRTSLDYPTEYIYWNKGRKRRFAPTILLAMLFAFYGLSMVCLFGLIYSFRTTIDYKIMLLMILPLTSFLLFHFLYRYLSSTLSCCVAITSNRILLYYKSFFQHHSIQFVYLNEIVSVTELATKKPKGFTLSPSRLMQSITNCVAYMRTGSSKQVEITWKNASGEEEVLHLNSMLVTDASRSEFVRFVRRLVEAAKNNTATPESN